MPKVLLAPFSRTRCKITPLWTRLTFSFCSLGVVITTSPVQWNAFHYTQLVFTRKHKELEFTRKHMLTSPMEHCITQMYTFQNLQRRRRTQHSSAPYIPVQTLNTDVAGFEIRLQFSWARSRLIKFSIWNTYFTRRLSRAAPVDVR